MHSAPDSAERRRGLKKPLALGGALVLHALVLLLAVSWHAPVLVSASFTGQGSPFSVPGAFVAKVSMVAMPRPAKPAPPRPRATNKPEPAANPARKPGATIRLASLFNPPRDVTPIAVAVALGGPAPSGIAPVTPSPAAAQAFAAATAGGKSCQILDVLQTLLRSSDEIRAAIQLIPARSRSVANAVMLWDGKWVDTPSLGGIAAVGPIQTMVLQIISAAPADCQAELVRGPRLITIGDARDTTVLAFGSGEWRWSDLLANPPLTQFVATKDD